MLMCGLLGAGVIVRHWASTSTTGLESRRKSCRRSCGHGVGDLTQLAFRTIFRDAEARSVEHCPGGLYGSIRLLVGQSQADRWC